MKLPNDVKQMLFDAVEKKVNNKSLQIHGTLASPTLIITIITGAVLMLDLIETITEDHDDVLNKISREEMGGTCICGKCKIN